MSFFEDLKNKKILIVGASQGIGRELCLNLNKHGSYIYSLSRNEEKLNELNNEIKSKSLVCDINDEKQVKSAIEKIEPLDGVCFVSGIVKLIPPKLLMRKTVEPQILTNLISPICFLGELLKKKKIKDSASIIFTSASARHNNSPCTVPYAAAKMGLIGAVKSLIKDLSFTRKIRLNNVSFDYVDTPMIKDVKIEDKNIIGVSPLKYTSIPYLFLLSEKSSWINGQIIAADAGRMLGKNRYV